MTATVDRSVSWRPRSEWELESACRDEDPDLFFPVDYQPATPIDALVVEDEPAHPIPAAKAICDRCPVRADCLAFALIERIPWGTFGGMSAYERGLISKKKSRKHCPGCGSDAIEPQGAVEICISCGVSWEAGLLDD